MGEVRSIRTDLIEPALGQVEESGRNLAGEARAAHVRFYTNWWYDEIGQTYSVRDARLAEFWWNLYAAVWDFSIAAEDFPLILTRYAQVDRVWRKIPWPAVLSAGGPSDLFAQCARGIPFFKGRDGVPRSLINPRFYSLAPGEYFPKTDSEIEVDFAAAYAMNYELIVRCIEAEIREKIEKIKKKIRRMKRSLTAMKILTAVLGGWAGIATVAATEAIERTVAKDNPEMAKIWTAVIGAAAGVLLPGSAVLTGAEAQAGKKVLDIGVGLLQAELEKRAAEQGAAQAEKLGTVAAFAREAGGLSMDDRDASLARWFVWVFETLTAQYFLDALAGRRGLAFDALSQVLEPMRREAEGKDEPAAETGAAAPGGGPLAPEGPKSVAATVAVPGILAVISAVAGAAL